MRSCDQCCPMSHIPHTTQWLFFSLRHYHHPPWCPPQPDQRYLDLNCCNRCRPMLHIGWFFIPLHHHHPPQCLARHPRTTSNLMCRPSLSLTLLTNSIPCHSPDLMSNFSPTALVTNVAHQLDPTSFIKLNPMSLTGLDVQLFTNRPCY